MSEKFELFFAIGLPRYHIRSRNHNAKERWNPGEFRNEESYKAAKRYLADEMEMNDDLLVGDFEDSYRNLSRKMQFFFTWAATFCRRSRPTFLFIDDDTPFSLKNLITAIHSLKGSQRSHLLHGVLANASVVQREVYRRPNKWSMLKVELPWPIYTPYLFGYYTLIGFDQIEKLALGMLFTRPFSVDDAWFGLVAARMGLRLHLIDEIITKDKILSTQTRFRKLH